MTLSARFALPLLHAGQAQKEMFHNEALTLIDALVHMSVVTADIDDPPEAPSAGDAWLVGDAPTGAWTDRDGQIALWSEGGWRFVAPREGMALWVESAGVPAHYAEGSWRIGSLTGARVEIDGIQVIGAQGAAIDAPSGGATIDTEARAAIAAVIEAMRTHGLIATAEL